MVFRKPVTETEAKNLNKLLDKFRQYQFHKFSKDKTIILYILLLLLQAFHCTVQAQEQNSEQYGWQQLII